MIIYIITGCNQSEVDSVVYAGTDRERANAQRYQLIYESVIEYDPDMVGKPKKEIEEFYWMGIDGMRKLTEYTVWPILVSAAELARESTIFSPVYGKD